MPWKKLLSALSAAALLVALGLPMAGCHANDDDLGDKIEDVGDEIEDAADEIEDDMDGR